MSEAIKKLYTDAGLTPPKGRGIHTVEFHRQAISIKKANPSYSMQRCYSIAMGNLGREKGVKKAHRQPTKVYKKQKRQRAASKTKKW